MKAMNELISTHGTPTWLIGRGNGGVVIQQGKSYVMLSAAEASRLLQLLSRSRRDGEVVPVAVGASE
jgi:hypothetical protein